MHRCGADIAGVPAELVVSLDSFRPVCFLVSCYTTPHLDRVFPPITSPSRDGKQPLDVRVSQLGGEFAGLYNSALGLGSVRH